MVTATEAAEAALEALEQRAAAEGRPVSQSQLSEALRALAEAEASSLVSFDKVFGEARQAR